MSDGIPERDHEVALQREVTRLALAGVDGFALAGSLDVGAIRSSGQFSDDHLVTAAAERDPGFAVDLFAEQLAAASRLQPAQVARYGVTAHQLDAVTARCVTWAEKLRNPAGSESTPP